MESFLLVVFQSSILVLLISPILRQLKMVISRICRVIYIYLNLYICLIYLLGFRQWNPQHFQSASANKNRNLRSSLPGLVANVESPTTNQGMVFGARASRGEYQALGVGPVGGYPVSTTGWSICLLVFFGFFLGN